MCRAAKIADKDMSRWCLPSADRYSASLPRNDGLPIMEVASLFLPLAEGHHLFHVAKSQNQIQI